MIKKLKKFYSSIKTVLDKGFIFLCLAAVIGAFLGMISSLIFTTVP